MKKHKIDFGRKYQFTWDLGYCPCYWSLLGPLTDLLEPCGLPDKTMPCRVPSWRSTICMCHKTISKLANICIYMHHIYVYIFTIYIYLYLADICSANIYIYIYIYVYLIYIYIYVWPYQYIYIFVSDENIDHIHIYVYVAFFLYMYICTYLL